MESLHCLSLLRSDDDIPLPTGPIFEWVLIGFGLSVAEMEEAPLAMTYLRMFISSSNDSMSSLR